MYHNIHTTAGVYLKILTLTLTLALNLNLTHTCSIYPVSIISPPIFRNSKTLRKHDTLFSVLFPGPFQVSVMIPERQYDDISPLHFCQRNVIVACFHFVSFCFKLLSLSKTFI